MSMTAKINYSALERTLNQFSEPDSPVCGMKLSEISDALAFECFYTKTNVLKLFNVQHLYCTDKKMMGSNPIYKGLVGFQKNKVEVQDKHFFIKSVEPKGLNKARENEVKKEVSEAKEVGMFDAEFCKTVFGMGFGDFMDESNRGVVRGLFVEKIGLLRKNLKIE